MKEFANEDLSKEDEEFLRDLEIQIEKFIRSGEEVLKFAPMNGYRRRLIHRMGSIYQLTTQSVGEQSERFVCLVRTDKTSIPEDKPSLTDTAQLMKEQNTSRNDTSRPRGDSPRNDTSRPGGDSPHKNFSRGDSPRRNASPRGGTPRGRNQEMFNVENQIFYTRPGTQIVLREDGSVGIPQPGDDPERLIDERIVEEDQFQIRNNRIVCASDTDERNA